MKQILLLVGLLFSLTGCGFKPQGNLPLATPLYKLYLKTPDPYGQLARNLRQYLTASGVCLTQSPTDANTVLEIISEQTAQLLLSVGGTQQTRQYSLVLTVVFQITGPLGKPLIDPQVVTESRTLPIPVSYTHLRAHET